jgi:ATP-dependent Clp protease ATP-binding subunit ClpX
LIKQYQKLFKLEGIELEFADDALDFIVTKADEFKLGARGLRSICEAIMTDAMFDMPSQEGLKHFIVTEEYCKDKLRHEIMNKLKVA